MFRRRFMKTIAAAFAAMIGFSTEVFARAKKKKSEPEVPPKKKAKPEASRESFAEELAGNIRKLEDEHGLKVDDFAIIVNPALQRLYLMKNRQVEKIYVASTSRRGLGNKQDSYRTPWGTHRIKEKIGDGAKRGTIFVHKENTKRIATITTKGPRSYTQITTRILSLDGQEEGVNRGKGIDSFERCIYIHGISTEQWVGRPCTGGCVVLTNDDVIDLFNRVSEGTLVEIQKKEYEAD